jgi:hypothetical protein
LHVRLKLPYIRREAVTRRIVKQTINCVSQGNRTPKLKKQVALNENELDRCVFWRIRYSYTNGETVRHGLT